MGPQADPGRSFTVRGVAAGLAVGTVICAANMYFGLQTGWVSVMSMPASLMGFAVFQLLRRHLEFPFTPAENVLVQSVACGMAIMPLGCGFVGVIPAMTYLLEPGERGPINLSTWQLIVWSLGLCYFGVVFAVPLRRQVIIRERLRFPSGLSTAVLISVLHGRGRKISKQELDAATKGGFASLVPRQEGGPEAALPSDDADDAEMQGDEGDAGSGADWARNMRLLLSCFLISGAMTLLNYFFPILRDVPVFGSVAAQEWLWTLNPSLAYVGQGIIMGTETTMHMAVGAVLGWGILSPLAKYKGWAPGPVDDWERGSKGWIVWVSLAIMLVDAVISLAYVALRPLLGPHVTRILARLQGRNGLGSHDRATDRYALLVSQEEEGDEQDEEEQDDGNALSVASHQSHHHHHHHHHHHQEGGGEGKEEQEDAPKDQQVTDRVVVMGLLASVALCIGTVHIVFGSLVPLYANVIAVLMALMLSIMGVRALGETDLNPVSGISKLAQLFFALIIPQSNKSSVLINLVAGAVSEAGALQAGDLMQDLKTGHLLGAAPKAQFWGQVIGATFGAIFSAFIYRIYTKVYEIPGSLFQVPTAYVWIFTARLVTGQGLPSMATEWALGAGVLFTMTTLARILSTGKRWRRWIPGGIAVAVGIYNVPSFTLARAIGGVIAWYWSSIAQRPSTPLIIMASGFILGEGFLSIVNLLMQGMEIPHF